MFHLNDVVLLLECLPQLGDGLRLLFSAPLSSRLRLLQLELPPIQIRRQLENSPIQLGLFFLFFLVQILQLRRRNIREIHLAEEKGTNYMDA